MRFSFMRPTPVTVLCALVAGLGAGCPQKESQPAPPTPPTVPSSHVIQDSPKPPAIPDAGATPSAAALRAGDDAGVTKDSANDAGAAAAVAPVDVNALHTFTGFSPDETRYAFSVYSEGAGAHLLQFVVGQQGTPKQRFLLDSDSSKQKAKAALEAGGFTQKAGTLPKGTTVEATAKDGKAQVTVTQDGAPPRIVYDGNPFLLGGGGAKVAKAKVEKVSPSGNVVAVRIESVAMTEFGGATTVVLVRVGAAK